MEFHRESKTRFARIAAVCHLVIRKQVIATGDVSVLKWLEECGGQLRDHHLIYMAARSGCIKVVKWLRDRRCLAWDRYLFEFAVDGGDIKMIEWLYDNGCPPGDRIVKYIMGHGQLEILKSLHERGLELPKDALLEAVAFSQLNMAKWLWEKGFRPDADNGIAFICAVRRGDLAVVKWMLEKGFSTAEEGYLLQAAVGNHIEMFKWLWLQGCPCSKFELAWIGGSDFKEWIKANPRR